MAADTHERAASAAERQNMTDASANAASCSELRVSITILGIIDEKRRWIIFHMFASKLRKISRGVEAVILAPFPQFS